MIENPPARTVCAATGNGGIRSDDGIRQAQVNIVVNATTQSTGATARGRIAVNDAINYRQCTMVENASSGGGVSGAKDRIRTDNAIAEYQIDCVVDAAPGLLFSLQYNPANVTVLTQAI